MGISKILTHGKYITVLLIMFCIYAANMPVFADSLRMQGHVPNIARYSLPVGTLPPNKSLHIAIGLPLRDKEGADALVKRLYNPKDPLYGKYLTPSEITKRFGPSEQDYNAVVSYLKSKGYSVKTHSSRLLVDANAPVSTIEKSLGTRITQYQHWTGKSFYAPESNPVMPKSISTKVTGIIGLDNLGSFKPHIEVSPLSALNGPGSGGGGTLIPSDIKTAYSLSGVTETGTGQTLGLFELDGYNASDITMYEGAFSLPAVPLTNVLIDGYSGAAGAGAVEVVLDIEMMLALAPGASGIKVYEGPNNASGILDTYNAILSDSATVKAVSSSWGAAEGTFSAGFYTSENTIFTSMALAGQSIFVAAGDAAAYDNSVSLSVDDPASQVYVTGVGGTQLSTNGPGGTYLSETTWKDLTDHSRSPFGGGGGGGISALNTIPSYQSGLTNPAPAPSGKTYSLTMRNVPDVSLNSAGQSSYLIAFNGGWYGCAGTSAAAPLWAAFAALVNQRRASNGLGALGFYNPYIYTIGESGSYNSNFHDINDSSDNIYFTAVTGYDDATGWGSFKGSTLLTTLGTAAIPSAPASLTPTSGDTQVVLNWPAVTNATSYNVKRSTTNGSGYSTISSPTTNSYTDSTVTNGNTYYYVVTAVNLWGESGNSSQATGQPVSSGSPPSAPSGLVATPGNAQVSLSWSASSGATSYNVKRSTTNGSGYSTINSPAGTSYTDSSVSNGTTYYYVVTAVNGNGESSNSSQVSATPQVPAPSAPTGLSAVAGNAQVSLSWSASAGATSYNIKRSTTNGSGYSTITSQAGTSYVDSSVSNSTTYYYVVSAVNAGGQSANSSQVSATPQVSAPAAPSGLTAVAGNASVSLTWSASGGATSYNVKRSTTNGSGYSTIASQAGTSYADSFVSNGTTYYYVVTAVNAGGESSNSAQAIATPNVPAPGAPSGLSATPGDSQIALSWSPASGASGYNVKRLNSNGYYVTVANVSTTSYTDTGLTNGTSYTYVVSAINAGGESASSSSVTATANPAVPGAPSNLQGVAGNGTAGLTWNAVAGASRYNVKRSTGSGGPYTTIGSNVISNQYTDSGLTNGSTYYYVVSAYNVSGESSNSAQATVVLPAISTKVISWYTSTAQATVVHYGTSPGALNTTYNDPTLVTNHRATLNGLTPGTTYYYQYQATVSGVTRWSSTLSFVP